MLLTNELETVYVGRLDPFEGRPRNLGAIPEADRAKLERMGADRMARMAPAGALRLPPLLEFRRIAWGIPDAAFSAAAAYDRMWAWQIPQDTSVTYGDTLIHKPESVRTREVQTAPRAIILTAGLLALDQLRSNGMDLGHIIHFANQGHWRLPIDGPDGREMKLMLVSTGDVVDSEDTRRLLDYGFIEEELRQLPDGAMAHVYTSDRPQMIPLRPHREFDE